MQPPKIESSTQEERQAYVLDAWKCLHCCDECGKCRILKGRDAEALYAEGEKPPIILDDPFVNLDEQRLAAAKRLLVELAKKYGEDQSKNFVNGILASIVKEKKLDGENINPVINDDNLIDPQIYITGIDGGTLEEITVTSEAPKLKYIPIPIIKKL